MNWKQFLKKARFYGYVAMYWKVSGITDPYVGLVAVQFMEKLYGE